MDKDYYERNSEIEWMKSGSMAALLVIVAAIAIAIAGWAIALTGGFPNLNSRSVDQLTEQERLRMTVYYGYYNVGSNIECISASAGETPSIEIYAENVYAPDAVIDFTLTAKRNADVSLEASDGFQLSAAKRLTVLEGTETLRQTFYVKPHADVDDIQLTLNAKAIDPPNIILVYTLPFSNTVVFSNDGSGNYCRE